MVIAETEMKEAVIILVEIFVRNGANKIADHIKSFGPET
jgi:hypothetical protein